jgi:mono/diheme cytochrome c family protein
MKRVKLLMAVSLSALFWVACGGGETTNTNGNSAPQPSTPSAASSNSASTQPATMAATNANESKPADEKKEEKKKEESKSDSMKPAAKIDAAGLFIANKCGGCHGTDGKGNPKIKGSPDFTDAAWQKKQSDADLAAVIRSGKKPMPGFGEKLSDAEIKALVGYVRAFGKK